MMPSSGQKGVYQCFRFVSYDLVYSCYVPLQEGYFQQEYKEKIKIYDRKVINF